MKAMFKEEEEIEALGSTWGLKFCKLLYLLTKNISKKNLTLYLQKLILIP